jgi:mannan endo-1,4-beta-mannosidase
MKTSQKIVFFFSLLSFPYNSAVIAQEKTMSPVTKNASAEAKALLKFFYRISGEYILTGQHNYPNVKNRNTRFAADYIGKTPVMYSTDWGFEKDGNSDSYLARQDIVNESIRQNKLGSIVTICWHAVPPTANEPVTFQPLPGADTNNLASVQGRLQDQQFKDLLTPGTSIYKHWAEQVDSIAVYLKKLQDAHVAILWRPYHEMNGDWFWWGGRQGEYSTIRLYRQLFDRLVNYHKLNNLVWIWSVDRPSTPPRKFSNFYPGNDFLDIVALDVYGSDFNQDYYDSLLVLSKGKPIVLGEVGNPPSTEILKLQPKWAYFVTWAGMVRNTLKNQYDILLKDSRVLFLEDTAYWNAIAPFRKSVGLSVLPVQKTEAANFSGQWIFNESKSKLDNQGTGNLPAKLEVIETNHELLIKRTMVSEYSDKTVMEQELRLDGIEKEFKAPFGNRPMMVKAIRSNTGDSLIVESKISFTNGGRTNELINHETWNLMDHDKVLLITQSSTSSRGRREIRIVYDKQ